MNAPLNSPGAFNKIARALQFLARGGIKNPHKLLRVLRSDNTYNIYLSYRIFDEIADAN